MTNPAEWVVIIVDDEPDNIGVVKLVLEFHDVQVMTADSGAACLTLLDTVAPTFFLIDIQMPEMDGFELLKQLKERGVSPTIPAIALTAKAMDGDREEILAAGFDGYIPKPIQAMAFVDEIKKILYGNGQ